MSGNQQQVEYWNGAAGDVWVTAQVQLDSSLAPLSELAIEAANIVEGERVIDVGCGCGSTAIAMAQRGARVWGIDVSAPMLAKAKERASGLSNVTFSETDAATQHYSADHQLIFSRFGVMFFADPVAAFVNLRQGLTDEGRLLFVCWQAAIKNDWIMVAGRAVQPFLSVSDASDAIDPNAPGPFAFADSDRIHSILNQSGYADIDITSVTPNLTMGQDLDEAMRLQAQIGPVARVIAELQEDKKGEAIAAARMALGEHQSSTGINLGAAAWIVSARKQ
ncbi:MAG: methyltransferase domain-containing protein [Gammaproteobacteria bacterium]|nr:methyltransferase domain-containing protein [Gammaproteobacteria bacterium]